MQSVGVCAPSGAFDHVYTLLRYGGAVAHAEASYMMPRGWPFRMGLRANGRHACLEYAFDVAGNVRERDTAASLQGLYRPGQSAGHGRRRPCGRPL